MELLTCKTAICNLYFYGQKSLNYLKLVTSNKCKGFLMKWVLLLHDNTCLRSLAPTVAEIKQLKFKIFPHLPYRPDLAPSDYHMFGQQKKPCTGKDLPLLKTLRAQCTHGFDHIC